jgi:Domain of unknown function (DUF4157)
MGVRRQMQRDEAAARSLLPQKNRLGLLQRKCACGGSTEFTDYCSQCQEDRLAGKSADAAAGVLSPAQTIRDLSFAAEKFSHHGFGPLPVQAKPKAMLSNITISTPGDPMEREADELAESVLTMAATPAQSQSERKAGLGCGNRSSGPGGERLSAADRAFFSPRFGHDFSDVRIHADRQAAASAHAVNALAYTVGSDIAFGEGQYKPGSAAGRRLLAHELAHVVQQRRADSAAQGVKLHRTAAACPTDWRTTVNDDHDRALGMLDVARGKLSAYDGTTPTEVNTALATHFHATSATFGGWVNLNLGFLRRVAPLVSYDCEDTSSWWCGGSANAKTFWCVPFVDIRVCQPSYFSNPDQDRSRILIHEWVHKYGCNFDLGYAWEPGYSNAWTITALLNADPFARFVQAVQ